MDTNTPKVIDWTPKLREKKEYEHVNAFSFPAAPDQAGDYIISLDWVSEKGDPTTPFQPRRFRPWAYEFQGARYWPVGTAEKQAQLKCLPVSAKAPSPVMSTQEPVEVSRSTEYTGTPGSPYSRYTRIPPSFQKLHQPRGLPSKPKLADFAATPRNPTTAFNQAQYMMTSSHF